MYNIRKDACHICQGISHDTNHLYNTKLKKDF